MDFNQYLDQAWTDHATDSLKVSRTFQSGIDLLKAESEIADLALLINHVMGQHLASFTEGIGWLRQLKAHKLASASDSQNLLSRYITGLELASGSAVELQKFSNSDKIRIYTLAANAICEQKKPEQVKHFLNSALEFAQVSLPADDPAYRSLAVAGNTVACALEDQDSRTSFEVDLMIFAAQIGRKYWQIAGTWQQVERAEYRLAKTFVKAGNFKKALEHSQNCIEIVSNNSGPALEYFFGYEALAYVEKARLNKIGFDLAFKQLESYFEKLSDSDKAWCEKFFISIQKAKAEKI